MWVFHDGLDPPGTGLDANSSDAETQEVQLGPPKLVLLRVCCQVGPLQVLQYLHEVGLVVLVLAEVYQSWAHCS